MSRGQDIEREVHGTTLAYAVHEGLVVFYSARDEVPADDEWDVYVHWLSRVLAAEGRLRVLVFGGNKAPTARQRSYMNSKLRMGDMRLAVVLRTVRLMPIVTIFSWFIPNTRGFGPHGLRDALAYLDVKPDPELTRLIDRLRGGR